MVWGWYGSGIVWWSGGDGVMAEVGSAAVVVVVVWSNRMIV